jgi:hypothetical protein
MPIPAGIEIDRRDDRMTRRSLFLLVVGTAAAACDALTGEATIRVAGRKVVDGDLERAEPTSLEKQVVVR